MPPIIAPLDLTERTTHTYMDPNWKKMLASTNALMAFQMPGWQNRHWTLAA